MVKRIGRALCALVLGGVVTLLGYFLFIGDPAISTSRKGHIYNAAQDWLVTTFGMTNTGTALIFLGVVGGIYGAYANLMDKSDEEDTV